MADKKMKRKIFELPKVADLDEIIEVEPVFNRQKRAQKQLSLSTKTTDKTTEKTTISQHSEAEQKVVAPPNSDEKCVETVQNLEQSKKHDEGVVHVGRNFLETFAFIEETKFYEKPKSSASASFSTSEAVSSGINAQTNPPVKPSKPNAIIVNQRQKGNPLLKFFQNVPWEYGDIIPDYVMGQKMCALFLSIRYHNFNPNYIHDRLKQLGNRFELRVLLVQVDTKDPHKTLKEVTKMAILADCTLILAWSAEEAARYLEMYKIYENKPPDVLQGQASTDYISQLSDCLTTIKSVNKTDTVTLISTFKSLEKVISASKDDIALCPGFGPLKAKRLHEAFHQPFIVNNTKDSSGECSKKAGTKTAET